MSATIKLADQASVWLPIKEDFNHELYSVNEPSIDIEDMTSFDGYLWQNPLPIWRNKQEMVAGIFCKKDGHQLRAMLPREDVLKMKKGAEFLSKFEPQLKEFNMKYHIDGLWDSVKIATKALTIVLAVSWLSRI